MCESYAINRFLEEIKMESMIPPDINKPLWNYWTYTPIKTRTYKNPRSLLTNQFKGYEFGNLYQSEFTNTDSISNRPMRPPQ